MVDIEKIVETKLLNESCGEERGLYILPMCKHLFVCSTIFTNTDSKPCEPVVEVIILDARSAET